MINFINGDATKPVAPGIKIIAHICNDVGAWGRGFVLAVSERWPIAKVEFKRWYADDEGFALGAVQFIKAEQEIVVANMVAQHGLRGRLITSPIDYDAVAKCLYRVGTKALELQASVHMPRIGCGLAGGDWTKIEPLIKSGIADRGIDVTVYDLG